MERNMQLRDWLDDLCVRFLMNGPKEDLETAERICFRVEEAQWYYEDFIRPLDPTLPSMTLKRFYEEIFAHCPLLLPFSQDHRMKAFDAFLSYKKRVPVRGAIMLNQDMDKVILVKGWKKGANWSFPRGKINKDEDDLDCAVREVYEETGFDLGEAGFIPENRQVKSIELNMHEQQIRLFVFRGIQMDTHFEPRTRKEISAINWWKLSDLPTFKRGKTQAQQQPVHKPANFYMVAPFLVHVRKWIAEQKKQDLKRHQIENLYHGASSGMSQDEALTEDDQRVDSNTEFFSREDEASPKKVNSLDGAATAGLDNFSDIREAHDLTQHISANNTGPALLALLHSHPNTANQLPLNDLSHKPHGYDSLTSHISSAPQQRASEVHNSSCGLPGSEYTLHEQSEEEPVLYRQPPIKKQYEKMIEAQKHIQAYHRNSNPGAHPHQPQHLIHPQPLPPHVQRTIFAQSPISASPLGLKSYSNLTSNPSSPQFSTTNSVIISENNKQGSLKFTNHTLALLNSFKNRNNGVNSITNYDVQTIGQTPESQYSYIDIPSVPTPPRRNLPLEQQGEFSSMFDSPWSAMSQQMAEEDGRRIQQHELEISQLYPTSEQGFHKEQVSPIKHSSWRQVSTNEYRSHENAQIPHLTSNHNHPRTWGNHNENLIVQPIYQENNPSIQNYSALNSSRSLPIQPLRKYDQDKNSLSYYQQDLRQHYKNTTHEFVSPQSHELPTKSSQSKQIPAPIGLPQTNTSPHNNFNSASVRQSSTDQLKSDLFGQIKTSNVNCTETLKSTSNLGISDSSTPSAVELSAIDPITAKSEKSFSQLLKKSTSDDTCLAPESLQETTNVAFEAQTNFSKSTDQEDKWNNLLQGVSIQPKSSKLNEENVSKALHRQSSKRMLHLFPSEALNYQENHSLLSETGVAPISESSRASELPKNVEYKHSKPVKYQKTLYSQPLEEVLPQSLHDLANNSISIISASNAHPPFKTKPLVTDFPTQQLKNKPISPSEKGFLLSYLEAVVAKGAHF